MTKVQIDSDHTGTFDEERGLEVITVIADAARRKEKIFQKDNLIITEKLPDGLEMGSLEHANYLFMMTILDHNVVSNKLWADALEMFKDNPSLLSTGFVARVGLNHIRYKIEEYLNYPFIGDKYPKRDHARMWIDNAQKLEREYGGDPRNIFQDVASTEELLEKLQEFRGYGRETSRLLTTYFHQLGVSDLSHLKLEPKVDFHDINFLIATELLKIQPYEGQVRRDDIVPLVRNFYLRVNDMNGFDIIDVDWNTWIIGANICNKEDFECCRRDCPVKGYPEGIDYCVGPMPSSAYHNGRIQLIDKKKGAIVETRRGPIKKTRWPNKDFTPPLF